MTAAAYLDSSTPTAGRLSCAHSATSPLPAVNAYGHAVPTQRQHAPIATFALLRTPPDMSAPTLGDVANAAQRRHLLDAPPLPQRVPPDASPISPPSPRHAAVATQASAQRQRTPVDVHRARDTCASPSSPSTMPAIPTFAPSTPTAPMILTPPSMPTTPTSPA